MKNIIECKRMAMEQTKPVLIVNCNTGKQFNINPMGFCIIQHNPETVLHWNNLGYCVEYDFVVFSDYNEMQLFINGCHAYDYMDNCQSIGNDEIVFCSWNDTMILF